MALLRFGFCIVAILSFGPICDSLKCPGAEVSPFADRNCIYLRKIEALTYGSIQWAIDQCKALNEPPYTWRLPKLETKKKNDDLEAIIEDRLEVENTSMYFWIDLRRDPPSPEEQQDISKWRDEKKWRWQSDNSLLAATFPNRTAPWETGEPSNNPKMPELCVFGDASYDALALHLKWYDAPCNGVPHLLVCEGVNGASVDKSGAGSRGTAVAIWIAVLILAVPLMAGMAWYIWRRRQIRMAQPMMGRRDSTDEALADGGGQNGIQGIISRYRRLIGSDT